MLCSILNCNIYTSNTFTMYCLHTGMAADGDDGIFSPLPSPSLTQALAPTMSAANNSPPPPPIPPPATQPSWYHTVQQQQQQPSLLRVSPDHRLQTSPREGIDEKEGPDSLTFNDTPSPLTISAKEIDAGSSSMDFTELTNNNQLEYSSDSTSSREAKLSFMSENSRKQDQSPPIPGVASAAGNTVCTEERAMEDEVATPLKGSTEVASQLVRVRVSGKRLREIESPLHRGSARPGDRYYRGTPPALSTGSARLDGSCEFGNGKKNKNEEELS